MIKKILLATALAALANAASAEMTSFRIGAAVGSARVDMDCTGMDKCDKTDTNYKVYGDYRLTDMWSVEAGYMKLGKLNASVYIPQYDVTSSATGKVTAPYVALAARLNIVQDLDGVVRVGFARVRTEGSILVNGSKVSETEIKVKPYIGLGVEYTIMPNLQAVVGADFTQAELMDNLTGTVSAFNVGVQYGF